MYAIQVPVGRERIEVRKYTNGFIPSYVSADELSMGKRLPAVPGYIFTMKTTGSAKKVPDNDWAVIEAICSTQISVLDVKTEKLISGPLKGLLILRVNPALKSVLIRAKLLNMTRDYWLPVQFAEAHTDEEPKSIQASKEADAVKDQTIGSRRKRNKNSGNIKNREEKKMAKKEIAYTEEQLQAAIEKAKEIGIHAAGKEAGIPWQAVMSAVKKAGISIEPKQVNKTQEAKKTAKAAKLAKVTKTAKDMKAEKAAENDNAEKAEKAAKKQKTGRKAIKANQPVKNPDMDAAVKNPATAKIEKTSSDTDAVRLENAVLRNENARLREKIEKLQKALQELI